MIRSLGWFFWIALLSPSLGVCCGRHIEPEAEAPARRTHLIHVVSNGWHTGILIPAKPLEQAIPELSIRFDRAKYYEIGWGDRDFYRARKITACMTLKALFWARGSILHIVAVPQSPRGTFPYAEIVSARISDRDLQALVNFTRDSFLRNGDGKVVDLGRGIYADSEFYDGAGRYSMFNTCNTWTAKGLRCAGVPISPTLKLSSGSIMGRLRRDPNWSGHQLSTTSKARSMAARAAR